MDNLMAAYSSGSEGNDSDNDNGPLSSPRLLPAPVRPTVSQEMSEAPVDSTVSRHDWEISEAPVPPKRAKIGIPEITADDDSDSDGETAPKQQENKATKLLSMLPAPKQKGKGVKNPILTVPAKPKPKSVPLVPRSVPRPKPKVEEKEKEESDESEDEGDFLGLNKDFTVPEEPGTSQQIISAVPFGPSRPPEDYDTSSAYRPPSPETVGPQPKVISTERAHDLIYKHEMQNWGITRPSQYDMPEIRDVSVDRQLGPDVRSNLLKHISTGDKIHPGKVEKQEEPGGLAKRKHQITYLAHMAKEKEEALKSQWASSRNKRVQTRQKYGF